MRFSRQVPSHKRRFNQSDGERSGKLFNTRLEINPAAPRNVSRHRNDLNANQTH
jgi:hypothetical protein